MSNTPIKQLTAVKWLINEIKEYHPDIIALYENECDQALAIQEVQIKQSYRMGYYERAEDFFMDAEGHYNSLYGKEENQ
jgi:hypothetical protein